MSLQGKIALVTGASRGIGQAVARRLAAQGAQVLLHYGQNLSAAEALQRELGERAHLVQADLNQVSQLDKIVKAVESLGHLDILVNNAGVAEYQDLASTSEEAFDRLFAVNVKAPYFLVQKLLPHLQSGGRIINVSSVVSQHAFPSVIAYTLTKGALDTLTIQLAALLGERNITVNGVAPGATHTDMSSWLGSSEGQAQALSLQALKRIGQADDIAAVVEFLAGPGAAWVTGQTIEASGGWSL